MTSQVSPVSSGSNAASASAAANSTAQQTTAASMDSHVSSMADLKEKAPEVYKAMCEGIAMHICNEMKDHQARIKKIKAEFRREA